MVKRCAVGGCSQESYQGVPLLSFPSDKKLSKKWDAFILKTRVDWFIGKGDGFDEVCALHFEPKDFVNLMQWKMGFANGLRRTKFAVPSILPSQVNSDNRSAVTKSGSSSGDLQSSSFGKLKLSMLHQ